jgi:hypothetical protein
MIAIRGAVLASIVASLVVAAPGIAAPKDEADDGKSVTLSEVPQPALAAARKELEAKPERAKIRLFGGQTAFEVEGTNRYAKHLSVVVSAEGKILKPVNIWDADDD